MQNERVLLTVNLYGTSIVLKTTESTSIKQIIQHLIDQQFIPRNIKPENVTIQSQRTNCVGFTYSHHHTIADISGYQSNKKNLSFEWSKNMDGEESQNIKTYSCKSKYVLHKALYYATNHEREKLESLCERKDISQNICKILRDLSERVEFESTSTDGACSFNGSDYQKILEENEKLSGEIYEMNHILSQISTNKICIGDFEQKIENFTRVDSCLLKSLLSKVYSGIPSTLPGQSELLQSIEEKNQPKKATSLEQFSACIYICEMVDHFTKNSKKVKEINELLFSAKDLQNLELQHIFLEKQNFVFVLQTGSETFGFFSEKPMQLHETQSKGFWFSSLDDDYICTDFIHLWKHEENKISLLDGFCVIYYDEMAKSIKVKRRQIDGMSGETGMKNIEDNEKQLTLKNVKLFMIDFQDY